VCAIYFAGVYYVSVLYYVGVLYYVCIVLCGCFVLCVFCTTWHVDAFTGDVYKHSNAAKNVMKGLAVARCVL